MSTSRSRNNKDSQYLVGIDLGTSNCALAYVDLAATTPAVQDLPIDQLVAPGETERRDGLPSFCYVPAAEEFEAGMLQVGRDGTDDYAVGEFARQHGGLVPGRLVSSAKSWLCHAGVDRLSPLLPWHGAPDVPRLSPVTASARYLRHLRGAWDRAFPGQALSRQVVTLAVPASFDEVARELTLAAAKEAGLGAVVLLEEPQAAFYAWMSATDAGARAALPHGSRVLVCDVGGGTSDFTLIEACGPDEASGAHYRRIAVGEHLILGGDNMDLALAHHVEERLPGGARLDPRRWGLLVQACRNAKETLLSARAPAQTAVHVPGGSRLIGGGLQVELTREDVQRLLLDGFLPHVTPDAVPVRTRSGFQEFGLPYAADAAITRHLAHFLMRHAAAAATPGEGAASIPTRVLFNGGVFEAPKLRDRLMEVMESWRQTLAPSTPVVEVMVQRRADLAVARGAAYAAWLRHQRAPRISAGLARSYYVQVAQEATSAPSGVCLAPAGLAEGHELTLPQSFALRIRQPVEFALYTSTLCPDDQAGDVVSIDPDRHVPLPPVRTVVKSGRSLRADSVDVHLCAQLTEVGTLDVRCAAVSGKRSWKLEFNVRAEAPGRDWPAESGGEDEAEATTVAVVEGADVACAQALQATFAPPHNPYQRPPDPARVVTSVEQAAGAGRDDWPLPLLRSMWEQTFNLKRERGRGAPYEERWLYLLGYALRPGYGYAVDDWRVQQTWSLHSEGVLHPDVEGCRTAWSLMWRRIAGGLDAEQQRQLAEPVWRALRADPVGRKSTLGVNEAAEMWRLLGALELLAVDLKIAVGEALLPRLKQQKTAPALLDAQWWTLARLGARVPSSGPLNGLVPVETAEAWLTEIAQGKRPHRAAVFAVTQLARHTGDRYRDLSAAMRTRVLAWLESQGAHARQIQLVTKGARLATADVRRVFGEALPPGLHLRNE